MDTLTIQLILCIPAFCIVLFGLVAWVYWSVKKDEPNVKKVVTPRTFTLQDIKDAYEDAYYEGTGDDAWYRDHADAESNLNVDAWVHKPMNEFIKGLLKNG